MSSESSDTYEGEDIEDLIEKHIHRFNQPYSFLFETNIDRRILQNVEKKSGYQKTNNLLVNKIKKKRSKQLYGEERTQKLLSLIQEGGDDVRVEDEVKTLPEIIYEHIDQLKERRKEMMARELHCKTFFPKLDEGKLEQLCEMLERGQEKAGVVERIERIEGQIDDLEKGTKEVEESEMLGSIQELVGRVFQDQ